MCLGESRSGSGDKSWMIHWFYSATLPSHRTHNGAWNLAPVKWKELQGTHWILIELLLGENQPSRFLEGCRVANNWSATRGVRNHNWSDKVLIGDK